MKNWKKKVVGNIYVGPYMYEPDAEDAQNSRTAPHGVETRPIGIGRTPSYIGYGY